MRFVFDIYSPTSYFLPFSFPLSYICTFFSPTSSTLPLKIEPMMSTHKYHNQDVHLPISSQDATLTGLDKLQRTEDNYVREDLLNNIMHDFFLASIDGNDIDSDFSAEDTDNEDIQVVGVISNISSNDASQLQPPLQQDDAAPPPTPLGNPDHIHLSYQQDTTNINLGGDSSSSYDQGSINSTLGGYVDSSFTLSKGEFDSTNMTSHPQYHQSMQMQNIPPKNSQSHQYNEASNSQAYQESLSYPSYAHDQTSSSHQPTYSPNEHHFQQAPSMASDTSQYYPAYGSEQLPQTDQSVTSTNYTPGESYSSSQGQYLYNGSYTQQGQ